MVSAENIDPARDVTFSTWSHKQIMAFSSDVQWLIHCTDTIWLLIGRASAGALQVLYMTSN